MSFVANLLTAIFRGAADAETSNASREAEVDSRISSTAAETFTRTHALVEARSHVYETTDLGHARVTSDDYNGPTNDPSADDYSGCSAGHGDHASIMDVIEHLGNQEFGSAIRDVSESKNVHDAVDAAGKGIADAMQTIGESLAKDQP